MRGVSVRVPRFIACKSYRTYDQITDQVSSIELISGVGVVQKCAKDIVADGRHRHSECAMVNTFAFKGTASGCGRL